MLFLIVSNIKKIEVEFKYVHVRKVVSFVPRIPKYFILNFFIFM